MSSQVTLKEIAEELGLSAMTVSRAINNKSNVDEKTRERVLEKAKSMGYTPNHVAKSLVSKKTYTIGVVIPEISHAFFPEVVRGIEEVTYSTNYHLILTHSAEQFEREKGAINTLRAKRVDGILISSSQTTDDYSFYEEVINSGIPVVFFDRCIENLGASCVSVNDKESSKLATEHVISHGYEKIAHLSGPLEVSIGRERYEGYREALEEAGLSVRDQWIVQSGYQEKGGYGAMQKLLALPEQERPRAVVAVNDPVAFGAIDAIREHGLSIPEDIAIVGFTDEVRSELVSCPLTTIHQPAYEVGKRGAQKLISTIEDDEPVIENIEIATELVIRKSCGCNG
ncbi:LacI family transcriptional regulator [Aliifodinibius sp. S!AR15-10]|uniref:LacI family DNA-binding transcriptional regulator n=1 Tax=Aliifodinibius sp. S!AR15-10 TaxID=2950437 RepID=UPI00285AAA9B|nr:LacI family DNA-binding transcriptional regulator [Aliifodinibius sp. S!AR15-10]MDR8392420.1 LacI family transcriptional regulator [Aliifodinibius sp. S!AR15-10]